MTDMIKRQKTISERAESIGARIKTPVQAQQAILISIDSLRKAADVLDNFSFSDKYVGVPKAYAGRIGQQMERLKTLQSRPFTQKNANAVGLAVVQSAELLKDIRRDVAESQAESSITGLMKSFADALRAVLEEVGKDALKAVPWWVWAGGAYLLFGRGGGRGSRRLLSL